MLLLSKRMTNRS